MYGFLKNVHDQSESEADEGQNPMISGTAQYLQNLEDTSSYQGDRNPGYQESRLFSGNVGRRTRRRLENARLPNVHDIPTLGRYSRSSQMRHGMGTRPNGDLNDDEKDAGGRFFNRSLSIYHPARPMFSAEERVFIDNPEAYIDAMFRDGRLLRSHRKSKKMFPDYDEDEDEDEDSKLARAKERQIRKLERVARRRQMKRQNEVESIERKLRALKLKDLKAALFSSRTPEGLDIGIVENAQEEVDKEEANDNDDDELRLRKMSHHQVAANAFLDAVMFDCASDNESIQTAVRKRIRENVAQLRSELKAKEQMGADILTWLSIPGGHSLVPEDDAAYAVKALRGSQSSSGEDYSTDDTDFTDDDGSEHKYQIMSPEAIASPVRGKLGVTENDIRFLSKLVTKAHEKTSSGDSKRSNGEGIKKDEAQRALQAAVEEILLLNQEEIMELSPAARKHFKRLREKRKKLEAKIARIERLEKKSGEEGKNMVDVNVKLDPVDYFNRVDSTLQKKLKRATHSPFLTELEALLIPFKFSQDVDRRRKILSPKTFTLIQIKDPSSGEMIFGDGSNDEIKTVLAKVNDPEAFCIECVDGYGRSLAKGVAQFHLLNVEEIDVVPKGKKECRTITVFRRNDLSFSLHPYSLQSLLKTIVRD